MKVASKPTYNVEIKERKVKQHGGKKSRSNHSQNEKR